MKTFSSFLNEVHYMKTRNKQEGLDAAGGVYPIHVHDLRKMERMKSTKTHYVFRHKRNNFCDHHFIKKELVDGIKPKDYHRFSNKEITPDVSFDSFRKKHKNGTETHEIGCLSSHNKSTIKAHEAYHHLITKHKYILSGSSHTTGGAKVWKKLSGMPGVNIHGWNRKRYTLDREANKPHPVDVHPKRDPHSKIWTPHYTSAYSKRLNVPDTIIAHKSQAKS